MSWNRPWTRTTFSWLKWRRRNRNWKLNWVRQSRSWKGDDMNVLSVWWVIGHELLWMSMIEKSKRQPHSFPKIFMPLALFCFSFVTTWNRLHMDWASLMYVWRLIWFKVTLAGWRWIGVSKSFSSDRGLLVCTCKTVWGRAGMRYCKLKSNVTLLMIMIRLRSSTMNSERTNAYVISNGPCLFSVDYCRRWNRWTCLMTIWRWAQRIWRTTWIWRMVSTWIGWFFLRIAWLLGWLTVLNKRTRRSSLSLFQQYLELLVRITSTVPSNVQCRSICERS